MIAILSLLNTRDTAYSLASHAYLGLGLGVTRSEVPDLLSELDCTKYISEVADVF